jgi:hypothetical protein
MALFETDYEDWRYATHGGTVLVVSVEGKPYGITARHVVRDFGWHRLTVTNRTHGDHIAGLKSVSYASDPKKGAVGTDIDDIVIIEFSDDIDAYYFGDDHYPLEATTTVRADMGDDLTVYGALKEKTVIVDRLIKPTFARLGFADTGPHRYDPFLRTCSAFWRDPEFTSISGISGAPVFNDTRQGLSGMMVRGGLSGSNASGIFLDFEDVLRIVVNAHTGSEGVDYVKIVRHPKLRPTKTT